MIGLKIDHLLQLLVGRSTALVPPILVIAGAMIFVDSKARHLRPLRLGAIILFTSVTLALASNNTLRPEHHGGLIGAYLHTGLEGLIGGIGVSILVVLGIGAAIVLITGASIGVMMRSSGRTVARAAESGARLSGEVARRYRERPASRPTLAAVPDPDKPKRRPQRPARRQPGVRRPVRRRPRLRARGGAARPRAPDRARAGAGAGRSAARCG